MPVRQDPNNPLAAIVDQTFKHTLEGRPFGSNVDLIERSQRKLETKRQSVMVKAKHIEAKKALYGVGASSARAKQAYAGLAQQMGLGVSSSYKAPCVECGKGVIMMGGGLSPTVPHCQDCRYRQQQALQSQMAALTTPPAPSFHLNVNGLSVSRHILCGKCGKTTPEAEVRNNGTLSGSDGLCNRCLDQIQKDLGIEATVDPAFLEMDDDEKAEYQLNRFQAWLIDMLSAIANGDITAKNFTVERTITINGRGEVNDSGDRAVRVEYAWSEEEIARRRRQAT